MDEILTAHWQLIENLTEQECPSDLLAWLAYKGSLTKQLRHLAEDEFQLKVLHQYWSTDEVGKKILCREVGLFCDEHLAIIAKTIIPKSTLQGETASLEYLGNRSLGDYLFTHPEVARSPIEVCYDDLRDEFSSVARPWLAGQTPAWARRSIFTIESRPLSIMEVFIPSYWTQSDA